MRALERNTTHDLRCLCHYHCHNEKKREQRRCPTAACSLKASRERRGGGARVSLTRIPAESRLVERDKVRRRLVLTLVISFLSSVMPDYCLRALVLLPRMPLEITEQSRGASPSYRRASLNQPPPINPSTSPSPALTRPGTRSSAHARIPDDWR